MVMLLCVALVGTPSEGVLVHYLYKGRVFHICAVYLLFWHNNGLVWGYWADSPANIRVLASVNRNGGVLNAIRRFLCPRIYLSSHDDVPLGCIEKVLTHSSPVNVTKLIFVLLVKGYLPLKKHGAEFDNLGYFWYSKSFRKHPSPNLEDFADLTYLLPANFRLQIVVFKIKLKLELESKKYHACGQDARFVLQKASVECDWFANIISNRLHVEQELARLTCAVHRLLQLQLEQTEKNHYEVKA